MPVGYDSPINEYWNVVERASLWDVSVQKVVEISGPDALAFMELLTPRSVSNIAVGQCRYIFLCNQDGGLLNDPVMLRIAEDRFWICCADGDVYLWAKGVAVFASMDVKIDTPEVYPMQLQGPKSPQIAAHLFGEGVLDLGYYRWIWVKYQGRDFVLSRTGYSSEIGFEIFMIGKQGGTQLWQDILAAGKPYGLSPGSPNRIRRIEGGVLDYGSDMSTSETPFEMGLGKRIDFDKGEFIGRAALWEMSQKPPVRQLVGAFIAGDALRKNNEHRWPVFAKDETKDETKDEIGNLVKIGEMTSAVHSPRLEKNIGFVLLQSDYLDGAHQLQVETAEGRRDIILTSMPFIDPEKKIPRAPLR